MISVFEGDLEYTENNETKIRKHTITRFLVIILNVFMVKINQVFFWEKIINIFDLYTELTEKSGK